MREIMILAIVSSLLACHEATHTEDASASISERKLYKLVDSPDLAGTVTIDGDSIEITAVRRRGGRSHEVVRFDQHEFESNVASLSDTEDCRLWAVSGQSAIYVTQVGSCSELGFGSSVDLTGKYSEERAITEGEYKLVENASFGGSIIVKNGHATLTVVRRTLGAGHGELGFDISELERNAIGKLAPTDDCILYISSVADGILVTQDGSCCEAGFGAFVDATGKFVKTKSP